MCRVLKVARAGFYVWLHNPVSAGEKDNQRLLALIRDSYTLSGGVMVIAESTAIFVKLVKCAAETRSPKS